MPRLGEPTRFQLIAQLVELEGIDSGPEGTPKDLDMKRATGLGVTLLSYETPPEDRVHHVLELDLAPVRQLPQLDGQVVIERQGGPHR